jgi:hypothetical protein
MSLQSSGNSCVEASAAAGHRDLGVRSGPEYEVLRYPPYGRTKRQSGPDADIAEGRNLIQVRICGMSDLSQQGAA